MLNNSMQNLDTKKETEATSIPQKKRHLVRSEKLQNESSPNFSNFRPEFCPEFFEEFSCFVSWETETRKHSPKIPAIFQWKIPRQIRKINSQNVSGERAKKTSRYQKKGRARYFQARMKTSSKPPTKALPAGYLEGQDRNLSCTVQRDTRKCSCYNPL